MQKILSPKREKLIEKYRGSKTEWNNKNIANYLVSNARRRAKNKGVECTIEPDDLKPLPTHCPILGIPLRKNQGSFKWDSYSIDRVDPSKGYIPGNVRIISWRANQIKGELSFEQIEKLYNYVKKEK